MASAKRRIFVIDDHPICATAVTHVVRSIDPAIEVEAFSSMRELSMIDDREGLSLILIDLRLPDVLGMQGVQAAVTMYPDTPVCVFTGQQDIGTIRQARAFAIAGYVPKTLPYDELREALVRLLAGDTALPFLHADDDDEDQVLSPAERRIMQALSLGLQNKQIAWELGISESTVKSHLAHIFAKLHVANRAQAIAVFGAMLEDDGAADRLPPARPIQGLSPDRH